MATSEEMMPVQNDSKESILLQLFRALDVKILAHWGPQWKNAQLREVPPVLLAWQGEQHRHRGLP